MPKISVIVRKAYGAGLYAMAGPAFDSDAVIALPSAQIAVMGPEPAVNAVFFNKLADLPETERAGRRKQLEDEYREDVDLYKLASNLIVDDVVEPEHLRDALIARFRLTAREPHALGPKARSPAGLSHPLVRHGVANNDYIERDARGDHGQLNPLDTERPAITRRLNGKLRRQRVLEAAKRSQRRRPPQRRGQRMRATTATQPIAR